MIKFRHLAITSPDPSSLASMFEKVFRMTVLRHEGDVFYLTDGYLHFVITPTKDGGPGGINHVGFYVDDLAEIRDDAAAAGLSAAPAAAAGLSPTDVAPEVAFWRVADGWDVEARERGWAETIAAHTDLYDLAPVPRPRTLQVQRDASDVEEGPDGARVRVCAADDLPVGGAARLEFDGQAVLVLNAGGTLYAVQDQCTHLRAGRLSDGGRDGCVVECHTHLARFDVTTGEVLAGPARRALRTYDVTVSDDDVWLSVA
jgi:3-phenylpropionate/trans-cinnamate dioxygenase ferredoxin subunit